eukprot:CAMPEP_0194278196 /NCGR_PEP_ID=MMETSP0169-20130528/10313_1 /TAXON_ID=218684 /ORGANISM="Corethron pennatum, Strain L29A3" /LENGTH=350 /DNA_ID=CAMNT_0039022331 /DNA_START=69 /DNA_END=1118 /DNA_ORIENTATION=-
MGYSVMASFVKVVSAAGIPSTQLVFTRAVFQLCLVVTGLLFYREKDGGRRMIWVPIGRSKRIVRVVLARGAIGGFGFVLYYFTIKSIPLGDAITLLSLTPIMTVFLARFTLGEPIQIPQLFASVLSVVGAVLIAGGPAHILALLSNSSTDTISAEARNYNPFGYVTALVGSFCSSCVLVLVRKAGTLGVHTLQLLFSWCLWGISFSCVLGLLLSIFSNSTVALLFQEEPWHSPSDPAVRWNIFAVCVIGSVAHFLLNYAGRFAPAGISSIIRSSSIMWGYLFEVTIFHQNPSLTTWLGVLIVLFSLVLVAWEKVVAFCVRKRQEQCATVSVVADGDVTTMMIDSHLEEVA